MIARRFNGVCVISTLLRNTPPCISGSTLPQAKLFSLRPAHKSSIDMRTVRHEATAVVSVNWA